ncbi:MAG: hypothetical protein J6B85_02670 [Lachnospiraceae bacterium]|nr:hypothetical protein [Lachnospiraceae bacterium]
MSELVELMEPLDTPLLKALRRHWEKTSRPSDATKRIVRQANALVIAKRQRAVQQ